MIYFILQRTTKTVRFYLLLLISTTCCLRPSIAQEQFIDKSFANSGIRLDSAFSANFFYLQMLVQSSGKVIVKANSQTGNNSYFFKFSNKGIIDSTFGQNGTLHLDTTFCRNIASDENGNIYINYIYPNIFGNYYISKINNDGKFDLTFGDKGRLILNYNSGSIYKYPILKNKKLYVYSYQSKPSKLFVSKYDLNGIKDTNFGNNGNLEIQSHGSNNPIEIDQYNNLYIVQNIHDTLYFSKYDSTAKLDLSLGQNGLIRLKSDVYSTEIKILDSLGFFGIDNQSITRYLNTGEPDSSFKEFNLTISETISNFNKVSDGYLVSTLKDYPIREFNIYKLNFNGTLDSNLTITKNLNKNYNFTSSIASEQLYYFSFEYTAQKGSLLSLEKLDLLGKTDTNFGNSGKTEWMSGFGNSYGILCQHLGNNELLQMSIESPGYMSNAYFTARKFNPKGQLMKPFGNNGILTYQKDISISNLTFGLDFTSEIDELGRFYYAGFRRKVHEDGYCQNLLRFLSNGNLDTSFANILLNSNNDICTNGRIAAFKRLKNKNILIAIDDLVNYSNSKLKLLDSNGVLIKNIELPPILPRFYINISQIQQADNGLIYISGEIYEYQGSNDFKVYAFISSYDQEGKLDTTFGKKSMWISDDYELQEAPTYSFSSLKIANQNDIFLLRIINYNQQVYKIRSSGILDTTYGQNGIIVDSSIIQKRIYKFLLDEEENVYLLKYSNSNILLTRYNSKGNIDSTYGINGNIQIPLNNHINYPTDFAMDEDKNIYITGTAKPATFTIKILNKLETSISKDKIKTFHSSIYPIPISQYFTVQLSHDNNEAIDINILNANGQFIRSLHSNLVSSTQKELKLNIGSNLNPGIYFLQINSLNNSEIIQIVLQ